MTYMNKLTVEIRGGGGNYRWSKLRSHSYALHTPIIALFTHSVHASTAPPAPVSSALIDTSQFAAGTAPRGEDSLLAGKAPGGMQLVTGKQAKGQQGRVVAGASVSYRQ